jgi:hypothetical protein
LKINATFWFLNLIVPGSVKTKIEEYDAPLIKAVAQPLIIELILLILLPVVFLLVRMIELREERQKFKKLMQIDLNDPNFETNLNQEAATATEVEVRHAEGWRYAREQLSIFSYYMPLKFTSIGTTIAITHLYGATLTNNRIAIISSACDELSKVFYETAADNYGLPHLPNYPDPKETNRNRRYDQI